MSVIFRSLQKLKAQADEGYRPAAPFKHQRRLRVPGSSRLANLRIVSLVVMIFLSGIGTSYGIYKIRRDTRTGGKADAAIALPATAVDPQRMSTVAWMPEKDSTPSRRDVGYVAAAKKDNDHREGAARRSPRRSPRSPTCPPASA